MKNPFSKNQEVKRLPEPDLKRIPIANLKFAPYQRELKPSKVNKIVNDFIPDIVGIALVSFRGGEFWCIDAQHRVNALAKLGYKEVMCQVLTGLTYKDECLRFEILNTGSTKLTANQIFHCRVEAREPEAIRLVELFTKYRFDYNKNSSTKYNNVIGAVSKFDKMRKTYSFDMVERVLKTIRNAWYGDKNSLSSAIITGLSTFFAENPNVDDVILIKALEQIAPAVLIAQANNYVKCEILRPGRADSACYHIAKIINELYEVEECKSMKRKSKRSM